MEVMTGIIILVLVLAFMSFFKKSIRKVARYTEDIVTTNISEGQAELIERSQEAYQEIIDSCGEDYLTPSEMYNRIHHIRKRTPNQAKAA